MDEINDLQKKINALHLEYQQVQKDDAENIFDEVKKIAAVQGPIAAIKFYRGKMGLSLFEAKNAVEHILSKQI